MAAFNYYGQNFGNPYGAGYFPQNGFQQPMIQQPVQPVQMPQPAQTMPSPSGIIWISGMQEAQMYPVAPNNAVALWENSGKTIYLKQADATGKPTMRIYDLVERTENASIAAGPHDEKAPAYATKDELGTIVEAMKSLAGEVDTMKGDLYGMAGRKKTVKKAEAIEDDA